MKLCERICACIVFVGLGAYFCVSLANTVQVPV